MKARSVDDYRLRLGDAEVVPIVVGGMGVDISTAELALEAARLGGVGHLSDAMIPAVCDRHYGTQFVRTKLMRFRESTEDPDKREVRFDLDELAEATALHVGQTMERKQGDGFIFVNVMEKLGMNAPRETLRVRLRSALDAGIDGITLSAGLHLGSFALLEDHPRFRDAKLGIIVSSLRALKLFLAKSARTGRLPDYIVVEGPLAGGHLGFGMDWAQFDLATIVVEVLDWLRAEQLAIPVIPAGGIFTGADAAGFLALGASAVQVATRFTVTRESGLPERVKQEYFKATEDDVEVNLQSPAGYPMRMLKRSPAIGASNRPNCESFGYVLDAAGTCGYLRSYYSALAAAPAGVPPIVRDKICLCTDMRAFDCWTCGHNVYRLKDTTIRRPDGSYALLTAEHVFNDYRYSTGGRIALPDPEIEAGAASPPHTTGAAELSRAASR